MHGAKIIDGRLDIGVSNFKTYVLESDSVPS